MMPKKSIAQKLVYPEQINVGQSIQKTAELLADTWSLRLLRQLMWNSETQKPETRPMRFSELKKQVPSISPKTLSRKLKAMERMGVVQKTLYAEVPVRAEYAITEKGKQLKDVLQAITAWNLRNL